MKTIRQSFGVSKAKLSQAMLEILQQLPEGTPNLKDTVVDNLGLLGHMSATRDINAAWTEAKKRAAKEDPFRFVLDGRKVLHWKDEAPPQLDKKISAVNFRKLNELAETDNCTVDALVSKMIAAYKKSKK